MAVASVLLLVIFCSPPAASQTPPTPQERYRRLADSIEQAERAADFARAADLYGQILELDPHNPRLHRGLGLVSYLSGRYERAIAALEQAAKLEPIAPGTQLYLGISYYRLNRFTEAIKALRRAPELDDSKNHLANYWLGASYRAEKNVALAIPFLQAARDRAPRDLEVLHLLARAYAEYSAELLSKLLATAPDAPAARLVYAEDLGAVSDAALQEIDRALVDDPLLVGAHLLRGQILWTQKRLDEGAEEYVRELTVNPLSYDAHLHLAAFHLDNGSPRFALGHLALCFKLRPQDARVLELLKEAETRASRQEQRMGSETHRCFREGELLAVVERYGSESDAGSDLEAARRPLSQQLEKPNTKALWYSAQGRLVEEALLWQAVLDQEPGDPSAIYFLAKAYDGLSAQAAGELFEFHPNSYRARLLRGEAFEKGARLDLDKALAEYQEAAKLAPDSPGVQHAVGRVLWKMNRFDEAIPSLEKELRISARHGSAHLLLGKIFLSRRQTGTAIAHLQEALEAQPDWVEAERDLGRALVMEGRYDEGIKTYQRILARDPVDASVHALLAIAYRTVGKLEEAKISAEKASDLKARKHQPK